MLGPIFGGNPDHSVSVLLLQVFESERGLLSFRVRLPAKSVSVLEIVLAEAGQPPPLSIVQTALCPDPIVVHPDCEGQWEYSEVTL